MEEANEQIPPEGHTEVYAWGSDKFGQLGLGNKKLPKNYPTPRLCTFNVEITMLSCGEEHSAFITKNGDIFTMGSNTMGQLGVGDESIKESWSPCLVSALTGVSATHISCGWGHTSAVANNGSLFTWGISEHGALGIGLIGNIGNIGNNIPGNTPKPQYSPTKVIFSHLENIYTRITYVSCGTRHTACIDRNGCLYTFGTGDAGQLGTGNLKPCPLPTRIVSIGEWVNRVECGIFHTLILTNTGKLYATGGNSNGQLGIGNKRSVSIPILIKDLSKVRISSISAGFHSAAVDTNGEGYIWGIDLMGEHLTPYPFTHFLEHSGNLQNIYIGGVFTMAVERTGNIYAWGDNSNGELALGDYMDRGMPARVRSLLGKKVAQVAAGGNFCMALGEVRGGRDLGINRDKISGSQPISPITREMMVEEMKIQELEKLRMKYESKGGEHDVNQRMVESIPNYRQEYSKNITAFSPSVSMNEGIGDGDLRHSLSQRGFSQPQLLQRSLNQRGASSSRYLIPHKSTQIKYNPPNRMNYKTTQPTPRITTPRRLTISPREQPKPITNPNTNTNKNKNNNYPNLNRTMEGLANQHDSDIKLIHILQDDIKYKKDITNILKNELKGEKQREESLATETKVLIDRLNSQELEIRQANTKLEQNKIEKDGIILNNKGLLLEKDDEIFHLKDLIKKASEKLEELNDQKNYIVIEREQEYSKLQLVIDDIQNKFKESEELNFDMQEGLRKEIKEGLNIITEYKDKYTIEYDDKQKLMDENSKLVDMVQIFEDEGKKHRECIDGLGAENSRLLSNIEEYEVNSNNKDEEILRLTTTIEDIKCELSGVNVEKDNLCEDVGKLRREKQEQSLQITQKDRQVSMGEREVERWREITNNLSEEKNTLLNKFCDLEKKNLELNNIMTEYMYNRAKEVKYKSIKALNSHRLTPTKRDKSSDFGASVSDRDPHIRDRDLHKDRDIYNNLPRRSGVIGEERQAIKIMKEMIQQRIQNVGGLRRSMRGSPYQQFPGSNSLGLTNSRNIYTEGGSMRGNTLGSLGNMGNSMENRNSMENMGNLGNSIDNLHTQNIQNMDNLHTQNPQTPQNTENIENAYTNTTQTIQNISSDNNISYTAAPILTLGPMETLELDYNKERKGYIQTHHPSAPKDTSISSMYTMPVQPSIINVGTSMETTSTVESREGQGGGNRNRDRRNPGMRKSTQQLVEMVQVLNSPVDQRPLTASDLMGRSEDERNTLSAYGKSNTNTSTKRREMDDFERKLMKQLGEL